MNSALAFDIRLDWRDQTAAREGRTIPICRKELFVLECLAQNAERPVSESDLNRHLYGEQLRGSNCINAHLYRLRPKLEPLGLRIATVINKGFLLMEAKP